MFWSLELEVSILVFLDLALRGGILPSTVAQQLSFNPCFLGSCSPSSGYEKVTSQPGRFNPCFLGSCSPSFTSFDDLGIRLSSFNPCFLGSCSPSHRALWWLRRPLQFQSLFSWILLSELQFAMPTREHLSFNPCFLGSCSPSHRALWWLRRPLQFQSLFSWILLSELQFAMPTREHLSFNPCFLGSCSPSWSRSPGCFCNSVSILVFLDLALRVPALLPCSFPIQFQSLFSWILLSE